MDAAQIESFLRAGGFHAFLDMRMESADEQRQTLALRLPYHAKYARIEAMGDYHGGILASLLDVAGTFACSLAAGRITPTINLRTDYLKNPAKCDLIATARVIRLGKTVAVADVEIRDDVGTLYAIARGDWSTA